MNTEASTVDYQFENEVATIHLNRPHRLNAVNTQLKEDLLAALDKAGRDNARVVLLRGRGKSFCAGHDMRHVEEPVSHQERTRRLQLVQDITRTLRTASYIAIAGVHGYALGSGCEFALACDLVVATDTATFGFPEVDVGMTLTGGATYFLPTLVGAHRAKSLVLLGDRFTAEMAKALGMVHEVTSPVDFDAALDRLAQQIRSKSARATALSKAALNAGPDGGLENALQIELAHAISSFEGGHRDAAAHAFAGQGA